MFNMSIDMV